MKRTRSVHLTGAILLACVIGLLPSITAWAGTFEAPAFVEANPDGSYSYEAIYTPGANETLDFESAEPIHNTTGLHFFGDGFCEIPLEEGVPFLVMGEPIYGWLVDPTSLGIHRVSIGTCRGPPDADGNALATRGSHFRTRGSRGGVGGHHHHRGIWGHHRNHDRALRVSGVHGQQRMRTRAIL